VKTETAAHTPGPWAYHATAGNHDFAIYPEATGRDVALVRDFNEANARLIVAAPELLQALRLAEAIIKDCEPVVLGDSDDAHRHRQGRAEIRAAIAKATT
jgi:hypothetical protein